MKNWGTHTQKCEFFVILIPKFITFESLIEIHYTNPIKQFRNSLNRDFSIFATKIPMRIRITIFFRFILILVVFIPFIAFGAGAQQISANRQENHKLIHNRSLKPNSSLPETQRQVQKIIKVYRSYEKLRSFLPANPITKPVQKKVENWAIKRIQKRIEKQSEFFLDKTTTMIIILILVLIFVLAVAAGRDVLGAFLDILMIILVLIIIFLLLKLLEVI